MFLLFGDESFNLETQHPWRRFFARFVDSVFYIPIGFLAGFYLSKLGYLFFPENNKIFVELFKNPLFGVSYQSIFWLPIEAIFLTRTGSTPGKWLFGIRVLNESGNKLPFITCLSRSISVWVKGFGLFIPLVPLFTIYFAYSRLKNTGTTLWDSSVNSRVRYQGFGYLRGIFSSFIILLVIINLSLLNDVNTHKNQVSQNAQKNDGEKLFVKGQEAFNAGNAKEAFQYLKMSADLGNLLGVHGVGLCYLEGVGVVKNESEAVIWFKKSADQGYPDGENELGNCYLNGKGIPKDYSIAVSYFRKAGEQGNIDSEYSLGLCYLNGWGLEKDLSQAKHWFKLAADHNHSNAKKALDLLK